MQQQKQTIRGSKLEKDAKATLKRTTPESSGLLKQLDTAIKQKDEQETLVKLKQRLLERCGCL